MAEHKAQHFLLIPKLKGATLALFCYDVTSEFSSGIGRRDSTLVLFFKVSDGAVARYGYRTDT